MEPQGRRRRLATTFAVLASATLARCATGEAPFTTGPADAGSIGDGRAPSDARASPDAAARDAEAPRRDGAPGDDVARAADAAAGDAATADAGPARDAAITEVQRSCAAADTPGCGLVDVPGGTFALGDPATTNGAPVQPNVTVGPLLVDAYEVTVARFRAFWAAGHPAVAAPVGYPGGDVVVGGAVTEPWPSNVESPSNWSPTPGTREAFPIDAVDWPTAMAFCVWDGGRLPTEAEWEWIARGRTGAGLASGRRYPWGDESPASTTGACDRANYAECESFTFRAVGSFAASGGVFDLAGNVAEWTADAYQPYGAGSCWTGAPRTDPLCTASDTGARTVRGGSWVSTVDDLLAAERHGLNAGYRDGVYGMRCVRSPR